MSLKPNAPLRRLNPFVRAGEEHTPRLSANAKLVLSVLREADQPMKAYALLDRLTEKGIQAPMTIYRALDRLIDVGLVRKVESLNAFAALPAPLGAPVAFIICRECGWTKTKLVDEAGLAWLRREGLDLETTYIESYGACFGCG